MAVPPLSGRVVDLTVTLNANEVQLLTDKLVGLEARKGSQMAVLIVPTTQPEDIAQFGIRVAETWKLGRKGVDDGVILIVAKADRKLRLEVGYGLEGVLPDVIAKRIISDTISPFFKAGNFAGGIDAGVSQTLGLIEGEQLPPPTDNAETRQSPDLFMVILIFGVVVGGVLSTILGRPAAALLAAVGSGTIAASLLGIGVAVFIAVVVLVLVGMQRSGGSGWSSGGGGFGGGGSWSGGGSSWGGGGGGFGGGGASDSW